MIKPILQAIVEDIDFTDLPPAWNTFDLEYFSSKKRLWDFQRKALENGIKALWLYYEKLKDFEKEKDLINNLERKKNLFEMYKRFYPELNLDLRINRKSIELLKDYYTEEEGKIPYWNFVNRMGFWMATGSGKTLVIIKLIHILKELIRRREIPDWDILFLTHRDDLIYQFKNLFEEVNKSGDIKVELRELREYSEIKGNYLNKENVVFYYKSDNISDEQKEKILDFRNFENYGKWYIILDEAHKGDKEESKRQHIYSILSRNGFLFNFSATFTDERDILTTVFEFNLSSFIRKGYGKHISILKQEVRAFKKNEDYNREEKQKILLKSLILLAYIKKFHERIKKIGKQLYHSPLLLVLVNSVNKEDSDLRLFFSELERIGRGDISKDLFNKAKIELWEELEKEPVYLFEEENFKANKNVFWEIQEKDIFRYIFNTESPGEIEVIKSREGKKELAFKLKSSDKPFALIKIGDVSEWLKELSGYAIYEKLESESYFRNLNRENSPINVLMGSRTFYEGWDSNRPNVILFINIGVGVNARKFVLQSIGRGVRIEPIKNKRRRLNYLYQSGEVGEDLFSKIKDYVLPLETLFIFGTNRKVLESVMKELRTQNANFKKEIEKNKKRKENKAEKFEIHKEELELLMRYIKSFDERVFLVLYNTEPIVIKTLKESFKNREKFYKYSDKKYGNVDLLIKKVLAYFREVLGDGRRNG
ncbi:hypothetical protein JCM9492_15560 [Aquifex pyrophilus]